MTWAEPAGPPGRNVGGPAANPKLSHERAAAVKAYLVQTGGIAAERFTTAGFGDTKPVAENAADEGSAQPPSRAGQEIAKASPP